MQLEYSFHHQNKAFIIQKETYLILVCSFPFVVRYMLLT